MSLAGRPRGAGDHHQAGGADGVVGEMMFGEPGDLESEILGHHHHVDRGLYYGIR